MPPTVNGLPTKALDFPIAGRPDRRYANMNPAASTSPQKAVNSANLAAEMNAAGAAGGGEVVTPGGRHNGAFWTNAHNHVTVRSAPGVVTTGLYLLPYAPGGQGSDPFLNYAPVSYQCAIDLATYTPGASGQTTFTAVYVQGGDPGQIKAGEWLLMYPTAGLFGVDGYNFAGQPEDADGPFMLMTPVRVSSAVQSGGVGGNVAVTLASPYTIPTAGMNAATATATIGGGVLTGATITYQGRYAWRRGTISVTLSGGAWTGAYTLADAGVYPDADGTHIPLVFYNADGTPASGSGAAGYLVITGHVAASAVRTAGGSGYTAGTYAVGQQPHVPAVVTGTGGSGAAGHGVVNTSGRIDSFVVDAAGTGTYTAITITFPCGPLACKPLTNSFLITAWDGFRTITTHASDDFTKLSATDPVTGKDAHGRTGYVQSGRKCYNEESGHAYTIESWDATAKTITTKEPIRPADINLGHSVFCGPGWGEGAKIVGHTFPDPDDGSYHSIIGAHGGTVADQTGGHLYFQQAQNWTVLRMRGGYIEASSSVDGLLILESHLTYLIAHAGPAFVTMRGGSVGYVQVTTGAAHWLLDGVTFEGTYQSDHPSFEADGTSRNCTWDNCTITSMPITAYVAGKGHTFRNFQCTDPAPAGMSLGGTGHTLDGVYFPVHCEAGSSGTYRNVPRISGDLSDWHADLNSKSVQVDEGTGAIVVATLDHDGVAAAGTPLGEAIPAVGPMPEVLSGPTDWTANPAGIFLPTTSGESRLRWEVQYADGEFRGAFTPPGSGAWSGGVLANVGGNDNLYIFSLQTDGVYCVRYVANVGTEFAGGLHPGFTFAVGSTYDWKVVSRGDNLKFYAKLESDPGYTLVVDFTETGRANKDKTGVGIFGNFSTGQTPVWRDLKFLIGNNPKVNADQTPFAAACACLQLAGKTI